MAFNLNKMQQRNIVLSTIKINNQMNDTKNQQCGANLIKWPRDRNVHFVYV